MIEIQLPNDIESKGWKNTNRFQCEQVFYSPSCGFTGTKYEFLAAGHAYEYIQLSPYRRVRV